MNNGGGFSAGGRSFVISTSSVMLRLPPSHRGEGLKKTIEASFDTSMP
jgi:hypothetical protein